VRALVAEKEGVSVWHISPSVRRVLRVSGSPAERRAEEAHPTFARLRKLPPSLKLVGVVALVIVFGLIGQFSSDHPLLVPSQASRWTFRM
jgi:hypothetical protein